MYQLMTAGQMVLAGRRDGARMTLRMCRTKRFYLLKVRWLFWTLIPTMLTREAQNMKQRVGQAVTGARPEP